jgi:hypothetical protein
MIIFIIGAPLILIICGSLIDPLHHSLGADWTAIIILMTVAFSFCFLFGAAAEFEDGERDLGKICMSGLKFFRGWIYYVIGLIAVSLVLGVLIYGI